MSDPRPDPTSEPIDPTSEPTDLSERYGSSSPRQRVIATVLIVVVAVTSVGFVGWSALFHSSPEVQSRLTYFDFPDDRTAIARLTVVRDAPDTIATCLLRAVSEDFAIVGETEITVTTGADDPVGRGRDPHRAAGHDGDHRRLHLQRPAAPALTPSRSRSSHADAPI